MDNFLSWITLDKENSFAPWLLPSNTAAMLLTSSPSLLGSTGTWHVLLVPYLLGRIKIQLSWKIFWYLQQRRSHKAVEKIVILLKSMQVLPLIPQGTGFHPPYCRNCICPGNLPPMLKASGELWYPLGMYDLQCLTTTWKWVRREY